MKEKILAFVKEYMKREGVTPSYREIGEGVGLKSTSRVNVYMTKLESEGEIIWHSGKRYEVRGMKYVEARDM